jgi:hypothetical protein
MHVIFGICICWIITVCKLLTCISGIRKARPAMARFRGEVKGSRELLGIRGSHSNP